LSDEENVRCPTTPRGAPRRRAGDAAGTHPRVGSARVGSFGRGAPAPARIASGFARERGREREMTHLVHGQRLDPRGGLPVREDGGRVLAAAAAAAAASAASAIVVAVAASAAAIVVAVAASPPVIVPASVVAPASARVVAPAAATSGVVGAVGASVRPAVGARVAAAAVAQVRGEVRHVGWCGSSARASPVCDAEG